MKAAVEVAKADLAPGMVADHLELTKPRITFLVVATTLVGFYLGSGESLDLMLLLQTLLGTGLVASGASALNMVFEWESDAKMRRTESRPIPARRLSVQQGAAFGIAITLLGVVHLWLFVNPLTSILSLITFALYLFAYTPLKKMTPLCTLVGAIPGAIPPMMGWTAVRNTLDFPAWWLFAILFVWQLPHFLAIAWLYKEDYARAGFPMLPVVDHQGTRTSSQIILQTVALLFITIFPAFLGLFHVAYFWGALVMGLVFLWMGIQLAINRTGPAARRVLLTSVMYLPLLLILMMLAKQ